MTKYEKLELEEMKWQEKADAALAKATEYQNKVAEIQKQKKEYLYETLNQTVKEIYATDEEIIDLITRFKKGEFNNAST